MDMSLFSKKKKEAPKSSDEKDLTHTLTCRDSRKNLAYFEEYISLTQSRIDKFNHKLKSGEVRDDRLEPVQQKVFDLRLDLLQAMYSAGYDRDKLREVFLEAISEFHVRTALHRYVRFIQTISFCILFDVEKSKAQNVIKRAKDDGLDDALFDYLSSYFIDIVISENILHKNPYGNLLNLVKGNEAESRIAIKKYLTKWYGGHSDMGWYNSHEHPSNIYSGYWSFESAALSKILGLGDESFEGEEYYPYGLI
jgi:hypothetical protein